MNKPAEQSPGLDYRKSLCVGRTSFTKIQEQLIKYCLCLVPLLSLPKDEERKKFFFSGFDITQPPKNGSEQKKKIGKKKSRSFYKLACLLSQNNMAIIKVVG